MSDKGPLLSKIPASRKTETESKEEIKATETPLVSQPRVIHWQREYKHLGFYVGRWHPAVPKDVAGADGHWGNPYREDIDGTREQIIECGQAYDSTRGHCFYCDKRLGPKLGRKGHWEMDHYLCLRDGGKDELTNVVPACFSCNRAKGTRTARQWAARLGKPIRCRRISPLTKRMCLRRCLPFCQACFYHQFLQ